MQILVSADIGGVANVSHPGQTRTDSGEYKRARRWATAEAGVAVRGAPDGGAADVLANDSHRGFRNLIPDSIDHRARLVLGKPHCPSMMIGVDGCDAVCMIDYRARAGNRGVLVHTIDSFVSAHVWFSEQGPSEAGPYGALAGERGVPVVVASGDNVFIKETRPLLPHTMFIETKQAEGQSAGTSFSPEQSCEAICAVVKATTRRSHFSMPLCLQVPIVCRLQVQTPALASLSCQWLTLERVDGTVLRFAVDPVEHAVRMFNSLSVMSAMLR